MMLTGYWEINAIVMKKILACLALLLSVAAGAQKEKFDILRFTIPSGWKTETKGNLFIISKTDQVNKTWCQIAVVKSTATKGSIETDFESEWNEFAVKQYNATGLQENEVVEGDGWKIKAGGGSFTYNNMPCMVLLTTMSGYRVCTSIVAATNSQDYTGDIQAFLETVDLDKPAGNAGNANQPGNAANPQAVKSNYTYSTANFDDGWTSVIQNDWVLVHKGNMKVYLFYALTYTASMFSGTGVRDRDYFWDNEVSKYFQIETKQYRDGGEYIGSLQPDYVEGWATDKQTGERKFIAMRLGVAPNTAYITLAVAPDDRTLYQQFPNANGKYTSDLGSMGGYNKFPIAAADVLGRWENGNSSTAHWYYVTPSGYESYAGMTLAATSAVFQFNTGGNYTSIHNGATGSVGNMSTFQQNYKGRYTVSNWSLNATNRWQGKAENFDAWFVAIRGGRILKLKSGGMEYSLVKTK